MAPNQINNLRSKVSNSGDRVLEKCDFCTSVTVLSFSPFRGIGGGCSVQPAFTAALISAFPESEVIFVGNAPALIRSLKSSPNLNIVFIHGLFFLIIPAVLMLLKIRAGNIRIFVIPRGNRLPSTISDSTVKSAWKKAIFWRLFSRLYTGLSFIFTSAGERQNFLQNSHISLIPHVVPDPYIIDEPVCERVDRVYPTRIVFLGRPSFEKNISFLVDLYSRTRTINVFLDLWIVGPDVPTILAKSVGARSFNGCKIVLMDAVELGEKRSLLDNSIVCVPSLYESFGLVCLESVNYGGYFIVTNNSYFRSVDSDFGIALDLDVDLWSGKIIDLAHNGYEKNSISRRSYLQNFSPQMTGCKLRSAVGLNE